MNKWTHSRKDGREGDWYTEQVRDPFSRRKMLFGSGCGGGGGLKGGFSELEKSRV